MDSILNSVKTQIGITNEIEYFDRDLIIHINTILTILEQIGVTDEILIISSNKETWSELFGDNKTKNLLKTYISLRVRLLFDPPISNPILDSINKTIGELEWRIQNYVDYEKEDNNEP